jgi:hypothetical protein
MINIFFTKILSLFASPVYAQVSTPPKLWLVVVGFNKIYSMIFPLGGLIATAMIVYGGYMWIISGGEPQRKQMAQGTLTWAVLGLVFLMLIKAILLVVMNLVAPA